MECESSEVWIERDRVLEREYQYEAANDDSGGEPARVELGVLVNFFGTLDCDKQLPVGEDDVLWLTDGDFVWL